MGEAYHFGNRIDETGKTSFRANRLGRHKGRREPVHAIQLVVRQPVVSRALADGQLVLTTGPIQTDRAAKITPGN